MGTSSMGVALANKVNSVSEVRAASSDEEWMTIE